MKIYIAGPMTGYPAFNFPAFEAAAAFLRYQGHEVITPAEQSYVVANGRALGDVPHAEYMRHDLLMMMNCEVVVTLPGWEDSKGASLEVAVARGIGLPVVALAEWGGGA